MYKVVNATEALPENFRPAVFDAYISYLDHGERTTQTYINNLRQFAAWINYSGITQPHREDIITYRSYLSQEHAAIQYDPDAPEGWSYRTDKSGAPIRICCKPATVSQYLRSVIQFFRWTASAGIYPNIAENVHAPKISSSVHKKEALQPEDVRRVISTLEDAIQAARTPQETEQARRIYAIFLLAVTAGLRTVEISRANIKDLEERGGQAYLYIWGKGHTEPDERKPLASGVYQAIKDYMDARTDHKTQSSPLFVATGNRSGGKRLASTTISTMIKRALQGAGYDSERITAHSLRHTAGTIAQDITGNLYVTQKYMRHSNPATTEIYLHNDTERLQKDLAEEIYNMFQGAGGGRKK